MYGYSLLRHLICTCNTAEIDFLVTCSRGSHRRADGIVSVGELALPLEQAVGLGDVRVNEHARAAHHAQAAACVVAHLVMAKKKDQICMYINVRYFFFLPTLTPLNATILFSKSPYCKAFSPHSVSLGNHSMKLMIKSYGRVCTYVCMHLLNFSKAVVYDDQVPLLKELPALLLRHNLEQQSMP